jgi:hypothetical protein
MVRSIVCGGGRRQIQIRESGLLSALMRSRAPACCVRLQLDGMVKDQLHRKGRASSTLHSTAPTNKQLHEGTTRSFYLLSCHVSSTACRCVEYREIKQREVAFLGQLTQRTAPLRVRIHRSALPSEQVLFLRIFEEGATRQSRTRVISTQLPWL